MKPIVEKLFETYNIVFKDANEFDKTYGPKKREIEKKIGEIFSKMINLVEARELSRENVCYSIANFMQFQFSPALNEITELAGQLELPDNLVSNAINKWAELKIKIENLKKLV